MPTFSSKVYTQVSLKPSNPFPRAFTACPDRFSGLNRTEALARREASPLGSYAALKDTAPHAPKVVL